MPTTHLHTPLDIRQEGDDEETTKGLYYIPICVFLFSLAVSPRHHLFRYCPMFQVSQNGFNFDIDYIQFKIQVDSLYAP